MEQQNKIKILIVTDSAGLQTGLAETTRNIFIPLLQKYPNKYEIQQLGFFNMSAREQVPWPIHTTRSRQNQNGHNELDMGDKYGEQSFHDLVNRIRPDIVWGYGDMWHFNHLIQSPYRNQYRLITYYTIDGQPYFGSRLEQDGSTEWGANLAKVDKLVVLSHFGKDTLQASCQEITNTDIKVMYHPMNMNQYTYTTSSMRAQIRDKLLPKVINRDVFIAGFVGRNQFRKQNHKLWEVAHYMIYGDYIECNACNRISVKEYNHSARRPKDPDKSHGDLEQLTLYNKDYRYECCWYCKSTNITPGTPDPNFYLWLHSPKKDPGYSHSLHERIWKIESNCLYTDNVDNAVGVPKQEIMAIMRSFDCMLYPSGGEGFGNPAFESMALGVPVVYSDYSSHAEFCKFGGLPIRVGAYVPELGIGINRAVIDTGSAVEQLLKLRRNKELKEELGKKAHIYVSQYNLPHMATAWDQIFTDVMSKPLPLNSNRIYATQI